MLQVVFILATSFVVSFLFTYLMRNRVPWGNRWPVFVIVFLTTWAASLWINPNLSIKYWWAGIIYIEIIISILLGSTVPVKFNNNNKVKTLKEHIKIELKPDREEKAALTRYNFLFLIVLILLSIAIITGYYYFKY
jgi:hypothetical protein